MFCNLLRSLFSMHAIACIALTVALDSTTAAPVIDFETTPGGGAPANDLVLPTTSFYTFGSLQISFGFDYDSNGSLEADAVFENAGLNVNEPPDGGFAGSHGTDTADPTFTAQLGNYFLRSPIAGSDFGKFVILYSGGTVTAASGEIWDIDGVMNEQGNFTEEYTVTAFDSLNNPLATVVSPLGTLPTPIAPRDGRPWIFSFSGQTAGIAKIEVDFTGTKPAGIGLAFNNFYPTAAVPEPASAVLAVGVAVALFTLRRRIFAQ